MAEPFLGEIRIFPFYNAPPSGWMLCDGQLLSIQSNPALFAILGNKYGGNGTTTFALPDLRGRVPQHTTVPVSTGLTGGAETHVLTINEMPIHRHPVNASQAGTNSEPTAQLWGKGVDTSTTTLPLYTAGSSSLIQMKANAINIAGGNMAHSNMQPYIVMSYCIAITGVYPVRD